MCICLSAQSNTLSIQMIESLPIESLSPIQLTLKTDVFSVLQGKYNAQRIVIIV